MSRPRSHLNLVDYIAPRWRLPRREVRRLLFNGKVNVNGKTWAYPDVPADLIGRDELGRLRIMVEGYPDPRPPEARLQLRRRNKEAA